MIYYLLVVLWLILGIIPVFLAIRSTGKFELIDLILFPTIIIGPFNFIARYIVMELWK